MAIQTIDEFRQYILDHVLVDVDELPIGRSAAWFNDPVSNRPTIFNQNESVPFDPQSSVIGIFQTDHSMRVYTLPKAAPNPKPADWVERPPTRYTLSKSAPTYVAEVMGLEVMAEALVNEINDQVPEDGILESVLAYIESLPETIKRQELIEALEDGSYLDAEDEQEAPPAPVVSAPTPTSAPS